MKKYEKEVQQAFLNNEEAVIKRLKQVYGQSLKDIEKKTQAIQDEINRLGTLAKLSVDADEKEKLLSMQQSKIYQRQYQQALKTQVSGILDNLHAEEFKTISDYLVKCYDEGFMGAMYSLQQQGIPMCFPIDQTAMVRAVQLDSKISQGLYSRLGEDVALLKKKITAQVSRGISTGMSFQQVAQQLAAETNIGYNNAVRISRTEGHRLQIQSADDACRKAKEKGADIVRQWDATLDGRTRESHSQVDGEIRELDKPFSNGLMFPGDPSGGAAEVVNCRCALLQRARWALDDDELQTLKKRAEFFGLDKSDSFVDFKTKYLDAVDNIFSVENPIKDINLSNMTIDEAEQAIKKAMFNLQAQTENMDYPYGLVFGHQASTARVQVKKDYNRAFAYNHKDDIVYVNPYDTSFGDYDFNEAMLHELAHRYDRTVVESWNSQGFKSSLTIAKEYAIRNAEALEKVVLDYSTDYYLQDIISIVSDGNIEVFAGHGHLEEDTQAREVFANLSSLRSRNAESYNALKNEFPDLIKEFETLFGGE